MKEERFEEFASLCGLDPEAAAGIASTLAVEYDNTLGLKKYLFDPETVPGDPKIENKYGRERAGRLWLASAYLAWPDAERRFLTLGYPVKLLHATMPDVGIWCRHHKKNYGTDGLAWVGISWISQQYRGNVLRFGRLQCNTKSFHSLGTVRSDTGEELVHDGEPVINLHIPEEGKLEIPACRESFRLMRSFFAEYHPDWKWVGAECVSWFLDPVFRELLPPDSNIVKFQNLGVSFSVPEKSDAVFRVFGTGDPFHVKNPTLLQRAMLEVLRGGGSFKTGGIFIPRPEF